MREALQILAVEDEKAVAQILAVVLGGPMAKVTRAADGWEALIKVAAAPKPFDVIITDHRMPRMNGLELVRLFGRGGTQPPQDAQQFFRLT